jgi:NAD(P)H-dependent FMN reductase
MPKLTIVVCSTRPGRIGPVVGKWFFGAVREHGKFDAQLVDLKELELPLLDEPEHPRLRKYQHEHTRRWSAIVDAADAFAFVTPEYDYTAPATLVNALQCLAHEWAYKPAGLVSYSAGPFGGVRAQQSIKPLISNMRMMPLPEAVAFGSVMKHVKDGVLVAEPVVADAAKILLNELLRWAEALKVLRQPK